MRKSPISILALLALLLLAPLNARAQYAPGDVTSQGFQGRVLDVGRAVQGVYPTAWRNAHNGSEPTGTEFVRRWALALRAEGVLACVNGKRGSDTLSQDVLAFPVTEGWARDTSGRYRGRIMVVDVIGNAGLSIASLSFGPDTSGADGRCINPYLEPSEIGGTTSAPGPGPGTPAPPAGPAPGVDTVAVLSELRALRAVVDELRARPDYTADLALVRQYLDDMIDKGPADDPNVPNHITDIKQREDKNREFLEQMLPLLQQIARSPVLRIGR